VPELQARVIGLLKQSPDDSYAFFGPTGVGKTTYLYAIYQHAVQVQLRACWCVQMPRLVSDLRALEFGTEKEPCLCRRMIQDAQEENLRPRIFVDEFDKVNVTDFALNSVGELVDTIYNFSGQDGKGVQFVMATNLNRQEFVSVWGNHILRRIEEMARVVDFFEAIAKLGSLEGNQLVATR
jgi:DNA replication protein DnaC